MFSDEKVFNATRKGPRTVRRKKGTGFEEKNMVFEDHSSVSVNVWAEIGYYGKGEIRMAVNIKDPAKGFDNESYLNMLKEVIPKVKNKFNARDKSRIIFQQDNSPVHMKIDRFKKEPFVFDTLKQLGVNCMRDWPARSPDMNVIENVWHLTQVELDKLLKNFKPKNSTQLFTLVKKAWDNVNNQKVLNIFNSFKKRLLIVKERNGKNISKY